MSNEKEDTYYAPEPTGMLGGFAEHGNDAGLAGIKSERTKPRKMYASSKELTAEELAEQRLEQYREMVEWKLDEANKRLHSIDTGVLWLVVLVFILILTVIFK